VAGGAWTRRPGKGSNVGCDAHGFLESRRTDRDHWWSFATLVLSRNYTLFAALTGTRAAEYDPPPPFPPRGVPHDLGWVAEGKYWLRITDKAEQAEWDGVIDTETAERYLRYGSVHHPTKPALISNPDYHTATWLSANELEVVHRHYQTLVRPASGWSHAATAVPAERQERYAALVAAGREEVIVEEGALYGIEAMLADARPGERRRTMYRLTHGRWGDEEHVEVGERETEPPCAELLAIIGALRGLEAGGDLARLVLYYDN
jgi:hypothetical protein